MTKLRKQISIWFQLHQTRHHLKNCSWGDVVCNFLHSMVKSAPEGDPFASHWLRKALKWVDNCFQLKGCPRYLFLLFPIYSLICDVHVWISRATYIHLLKQLSYSIYYVINPLSRRFPCSSFFNIFELDRDHLLSCPQSQKVSTSFWWAKSLALTRGTPPRSSRKPGWVFDQFHRATPGALEAPIWNTK